MTVVVETGIWQLDTARSTVALRHKSMGGMMTVKGVFTSFTGEGEVRPDGSALGTLTLDAASLDTKNPKRDTHLRSAQLLDVEKHPAITFTVLSAVPGDDSTVKISGELTVLGVGVPQSFTARLTDVGPDGVTVNGELSLRDRKQFGMVWNPLGMMSGPTTVTATLRFVRASV
ncbi:YceI family protein [Streptomyces sp. NPDC052236]|uniref:YceI family protein n=1 Tax=Streptomyces sp. NPDC052236 TaxID=3365686 RepID=UPI0037D4F202